MATAVEHNQYKSYLLFIHTAVRQKVSSVWPSVLTLCSYIGSKKMPDILNTTPRLCYKCTNQTKRSLALKPSTVQQSSSSTQLVSPEFLLHLKVWRSDRVEMIGQGGESNWWQRQTEVQSVQNIHVIQENTREYKRI